MQRRDIRRDTNFIISKIYRRLNTNVFCTAPTDTPAITHPGGFNEIGCDLAL